MAAARNTRSATVAKRRFLIAAIFSGVLYGFAFPPFNLTSLAWIALVPLLVCLDFSPKRNFFFGWLGGFVASLFIFVWLWKTFAAAQVGMALAFVCWVALSAVVGLYHGAFLLLIGLVRPVWWRGWAAGLFWVGLEIIRTHALTGFPWALLAHTRAYDTHLIQITYYTGTAGLSFLIVLVNVALADVFVRPTHKGRAVLIAALVTAAVWGWGYRELSQESARPASMINVAILQADIDQYEKWDDAYESGIRTTYEELLAEAAAKKPDLIVWPESAVPGWFPNQIQYNVWVSSVVRASGVHNIVGAVTSSGGEFNSAFLIGPDGNVIARYDKHHLVPFGEYIPFGGFLGKWIPYLGSLGTFDAGTGPVDFQFNGVSVAPNICYEAIFPNLVRQSVGSSTSFIVNITNDGWFLNTGAPEQHYVTNIFRAVENRTPVVRAANTGISAVIDAYGREVRRSSLLKKEVLFAPVPLARRAN